LAHILLQVHFFACQLKIAERGSHGNHAIMHESIRNA
jgi:hypothetical protein